MGAVFAVHIIAAQDLGPCLPDLFRHLVNEFGEDGQDAGRWAKLRIQQVPVQLKKQNNTSNFLSAAAPLLKNQEDTKK